MARTERDKKMLKVLGAVVAVAVLAVGFKVLTGHKAPATTTTSAAGGSGVVVPPAPSPSPSPKQQKSGGVTFGGIDPFEPLVTAPASGADAAPTVAPAGSTDPTSGSSAVVGGKTVTLLSVYTESGLDKVQVDVDGTVYTAATGDNFTGDYTLVSISDPCADFSYQTTSFQLCLSQTTGS